MELRSRHRCVAKVEVVIYPHVYRAHTSNSNAGIECVKHQELPETNRPTLWEENYPEEGGHLGGAFVRFLQ